MDELGRGTSFLVGIATGWIVIGLALGLPRTVRSLHRWTSRALFSSLSASKQRVATLIGSLCVLWFVVVGGALYTPVHTLAPEVLPLPEGVAGVIITVNLWILVIVLPLVVGAIEAAAYSGGLRRRLAVVPQAYLHVPVVGAALILLVPSIIWLRIAVLLGLRKHEQYRVVIDPQQYDHVIEALRANLAEVGLPARIVAPPRAVSWARWLLHTHGPPLGRPSESYTVRQISSDGLDMLVFDGLLDVTCDKQTRGRLRSALFGRLPPDGFWWTRDADARSLELSIRTGDLSGVPARLAALDTDLDEWRMLNVSYLHAVRLVPLPGSLVNTADAAEQ